jgi:hypothetical protein
MRICLLRTARDGPALHGTIKIWHALVASVSGTSIQQRLHSDPDRLRHHTGILAVPLRTELVQQLTPLDMCAGDAGTVAVVHSLAALQHLQLWTHPAARRIKFDLDAAGVDVAPRQFSSLRTLHLYQTWPEAFFIPGVAARLQQLHSLCIEDCELAVDEEIPLLLLPDEVLRLPTLERLELIALDLFYLPDMRGLPALRSLVISDGLQLRAG